MAVADAAELAIEYSITPETTDPGTLWGLTWRARATAWMTRHRTILVQALA